MEEIKKKNKKILGIPVALFVVGLLVIGGASAALIGYISNMTTAKVTVSSPIEQEISIDNSNWGTDTVTFEPAYGGESITLYVKDTNMADVAITGDVNNVVTNTDGVNCDDFVSVEVSTITTINGVAEPVSGPHDLIGLGLCDDSGDDVKFSYGPTPMTLVVGQVDISTIVATFKTDASGTYTFTTQVVPLVTE